jgi:hypothetical protein
MNYKLQITNNNKAQPSWMLCLFSAGLWAFSGRSLETKETSYLGVRPGPILRNQYFLESGPSIYCKKREIDKIRCPFTSIILTAEWTPATAKNAVPE